MQADSETNPIIANIHAVRDTGRRPIMRPKINFRIRGFNALADMLRFCRDHPGTFYGLVVLRNNVEGVFS